MIVGLTGGIGSGKTTVAQLFETMGAVIYNSDEKAKEVYYQADVQQKVIELLGNKAYVNKGEIDKNFISQQVFSNTDLLHQLNAIIHPAVKNDFILFQVKFPSNTLIIKESALLFETGIYKNVDYTILVTAPLTLKIERVMNRNSISSIEVEKRIAAQWTDEQKTPLANFVIVNDNVHPLIPQALKVIEELKQWGFTK